MGLLPKKSNSDLSAAKKSRIWTLHDKDYNPTKIYRKTKIPRIVVNMSLRIAPGELGGAYP
jgi:hypothetical protein